MWFKKKSVLLAKGHYNSNTAFDGADWRRLNKTKTWFSSLTPPSAADAGNYFYLPALGTYAYGQLHDVGYNGIYWSSSANPWDSDYACNLNFDSSSVNVGNGYLNYGFRVEALQ